MEKKETPKQKGIREQTVSEMIKMMTASFGLIAALAWNQVVQEIVNTCIKPFFGQESGIISLLIYAVFITILAVVVTFLFGRFVKND